MEGGILAENVSLRLVESLLQPETRLEMRRLPLAGIVLTLYYRIQPGDRSWCERSERC